MRRLGFVKSLNVHQDDMLLMICSNISTFLEKAAKGFMSSSYIFLYFVSTSEEPLSISSAYCKAQHNKGQMLDNVKYVKSIIRIYAKPSLVL